MPASGLFCGSVMTPVMDPSSPCAQRAGANIIASSVRRDGLLRGNMRETLVILIANVLENIPAGRQGPRVLNRPRPGERPSILERNIHFQVAQVGTPIAFRYMQFFSMGIEFQP